VAAAAAELLLVFLTPTGSLRSFQACNVQPDNPGRRWYRLSIRIRHDTVKLVRGGALHEIARALEMELLVVWWSLCALAGNRLRGRRKWGGILVFLELCRI